MCELSSANGGSFLDLSMCAGIGTLGYPGIGHTFNERFCCNLKVLGSIPGIGTFFRKYFSVNLD